MGTLSLPPEVEAVFCEVRTCEFTTVNRRGQPLRGEWAPEFSGGAEFHIESDWKPGSPVLWKGQGGNVIVEGKVTAVEPKTFLRFTVFDVRGEKPPVTDEDGITYELTEHAGKTTLRLLQGDFSVMPEGEKYQRLSADVWDRVLTKVKALAEKEKEK